MIKRIIAIVALLALMLSMTALGTLSASAASSDWFDKKAAEGVDYSFAVLGDIQTITYSDAHNGTKYLEGMFDWIIDNREERKIEYVIGLGDSVETLRSNPGGAVANPKEWQKVRVQLRKLLEADMPHLVVRGNHDDETGYHQYVCTDEYQAQMDGFFYDSSKVATHGNSMSNCYRKLEIGNHKYLMLGLDYNAWDDEDVIAWANDLVASNRDYKVILSIHSYLNGFGNYYKDKIGSSTANFIGYDELYFNAQELWNDFVAKHENMFMVLCGHYSATYPILKVAKGNNGNKVYKLLIDPQTYEEKDPSGFVYMINIKNGGTDMELEYFSTAKEKYFGTNCQMKLELPEGFLPTFIPLVVTEATTTAEPTTEVVTTTEEPKKKGCRGSITSTAMVCCTLGTSLAAFAVRKRKYD